MTTSVFTQQAEAQAGPPGYKPIDLIHGQRLVDLLPEHNLGIKQTIVVDEEFFAPFR
jgi:restriction endonuclease Mrr